MKSRTTKVLIAGMMLSNVWSFSAHAGLMSAEACKILKEKGLNPPAALCGPSSSPTPNVVVTTTSTTTTTTLPAHVPVAEAVHEPVETDAADEETNNPADPAIPFSLQPADVNDHNNDLDPGEYGPDNLAGIGFGFMHTKQGCKVQEGPLLHKETYCTKEDQKPAQEKSGMVKAITEMLETVKNKAATAKVNIAYFSFSNVGVQMKLCELSKAGVPIRVFLDGGSAGQIDQNIMNNPACKDASGKLNVKLSYLGGQTNGGAGGIWRLHHNKFMMIDPGDGGDVKFNFSSGNLSTFGTSLHLDHWVTTEAPRKSNLIKAQYCVMDGLEAAAEVAENGGGMGDPTSADKAIANAYINERENCFDKNNVLPRVSGGNMQAQIDTILQREQIAPLFSPNNNMYVEKAFITSIGRIPKNGYMYIAIQHFLHKGVATALQQAAARGVDVRIIMDDDALRGESEVPGVDAMIESLVEDSNGRIQVRLAETNHNAGGNGAMMHNKLAILNGEMTFSGAGHYTSAALRNNWENFYFVKNPVVLKSYAQYFNYLWSQSVDIAYTKSKGAIPSSKPSALKPEFMNLAQ